MSAPENGWRALREAREREFRLNFAPLRRVIRRDELLSSVVELFLGAVVGVTKLNLGAGPEEELDARTAPLADEGPADGGAADASQPKP